VITQAEQHLTEGEVIRAVDQQLAPDEQARVSEHLRSCASCSEQLQRAQRRLARLANVLEAADFAVPAATVPTSKSRVIDLGAARARRAQRWQQPWLRAAAAIVLLLGVAMTISPVRAAVIQWVRTQWERIAPAAEPRGEPAVPAQPPTAPLGPGINFTHEGSAFSLEFTNAQTGGSLAVRYGSTDQVYAETSSPAAELLVLPGGLRVNNREADSANYTLVLPTSITSVLIKVGETTVANLSRAQLQAGATVQLSVR
jgi:hypothetical protein